MLAGLTRLVTIDDTSRRARRRITLASLTQPLRVALQVFVDRRLLLSDIDHEGQVWRAVAHEALFTGWHPLGTAIADITVALRTARTVEQAAAEWTSAGRAKHYLWDDKRLTAARSALRTTDDSDRNPAMPPLVELDDQGRRFSRPTPSVSTPSSNVTGAPHPHHHRAVHPAGARADRRWSRGLATATSQRRPTPCHRLGHGGSGRADSRPGSPGALQLGIAAKQFDTGPQTHVSLLQTLESTSYVRRLGPCAWDPRWVSFP